MRRMDESRLMRFAREALRYYAGTALVAFVAYGLWFMMDGPPTIDLLGWMAIVLIGSSFGLIGICKPQR